MATAASTQILQKLGIPINANTTAAMQEWMAAEGGSNNNWLNVSPDGKLASYKTVADGVAATVATINQSNMAGIKQAFLSGDPAAVQQAVIASPWSENHYAGTTYGGGNTNATLDSAVTTSTATTPSAPQPTPAEIAQRMKTAYGYGSWATQNKELFPILVKAVQNGWDQNTFLGAVTATKWYKTTSESQRDWQITQSTDPAKAAAELQQARAKVLAVENQSGVQLSAAQVEQIAHQLASNSANQTGVLGSQAGFTQEQLEQAVVKAGNLGKQTGNGANTDTLGGIAGQLLNQFKSVAQQYLMYDPKNPNASLVSDQSLVSQVQAAMQKYTGSGSFGSSNLINGAVADFTQQMVEQATRLYPSLAQSIAAGTKPQDYVQPLQRFVANTLGFGENAAAVNVLDPQWNWMIATPDPKTGVKTALTQDQILSKITNPNFSFTNPDGQRMTFDNTDTALQMANTVTNGLSSMFGTGGK